MQDFHTLCDLDQAAILARALEEISAMPGCYTIDDLAANRDTTADIVWNDICNKARVPPCGIPARLRGALSSA